MLAWWILGGFLITFAVAWGVSKTRRLFSQINDADPPMLTTFGYALDPVEQWAERNERPLRDPPPPRPDNTGDGPTAD